MGRIQPPGTIEIGGAMLTPAVIGFIRNLQADNGEAFRCYIRGMRTILFYAIRNSIESKEFDTLQDSTIDAIYFLEELKAFE
jgi:hypothetical protein